MIEPEIAFCDLNMLMDIEEAFLKYVVAAVLEQCGDELAFLDGYTKSGLVEKLRALAGGGMARVSHAEAIEFCSAAAPRLNTRHSRGATLRASTRST